MPVTASTMTRAMTASFFTGTPAPVARCRLPVARLATRNRQQATRSLTSPRACENFHGPAAWALILHHAGNPMAKISIDGIEVEVLDGINVIEAAKAADVHVPHFCYHPSLTIVGQCRMCLVEVEGMPKLQAGCATPVKEGLKIHVWNEKVDKARKGQMEFLLINHPLDCPICDKAGECPLQDYSFNYGSVGSRYSEVKRTYPGMDRTSIGPHVLQNMNRCIHCTRCIRFCQEITGTSELAFFKRGTSTEVAVFPGTPLDNWMSACVTDVCPTGALTTRAFRFESRVWNLDSTESVCNGCEVGCNIFIGHRNGQIFRYRPRVNEAVNDHWLCDYGRFSHERYDTDRVVVPKVRNQ